MWTTNMVKFLFGIFTLSAGMSWIVLGAIIAEGSMRVATQLPSSLWYTIGWISMVGGFITCMLGVFLVWHLAFDFIKDQTYHFRNNYNNKE